MYIDDKILMSKTLQFSFKAQELRKQGKNIFSLGLGEPDFDTPEHIKDATFNAISQGYTRYSAAQGLPELRELVASKLTLENNIKAKPNEIIITPGAKNALFLACAAMLCPGDEVINFSPCYVSNNPIIKLAEPQAIVHDVPLDKNSFSFNEQLFEIINPKVKLIVINYPNNPTGKMIDEDEIETLRRVIQENDSYLLSDEIYEKIVFSEKQHLSPAMYDDIHEKVITVNGFSKAYAMTGWRIGYVHASDEIVSVMLKIHQQLNTNTAAFIQKGAVKALEGSQEHISIFIENLKNRINLYTQFLKANNKLSGFIPEGGFFAFLNISETGLLSDEFCTQLLEKTGVAIIPGISFGKEFDDHVRVSLVNSTDVIEEGLSLIDKFVKKLVSYREKNQGSTY